ncbi:Putative thioredoxin [Mycobacterium basiliense]
MLHAKVDTQAEQELAAAAGIRSIPTIMAFRDGVLVYSQPGATPPAVLENLINQMKSLDMAEVRAKIAARKAEAVG